MTNDARLIMEAAISDAMPGKAVRKALKEISFSGGRVILIAAGKAAWE
ncbi:MAG: DUF4147 domain-containing protein, partial [Lachnospiraceae bacterium]|nr:DUF4147 domain-containing protein [Candidatus Minthocola equi]